MIGFIRSFFARYVSDKFFGNHAEVISKGNERRCSKSDVNAGIAFAIGDADHHAILTMDILLTKINITFRPNFEFLHLLDPFLMPVSIIHRFEIETRRNCNSQIGAAA